MQTKHPLNSALNIIFQIYYTIAIDECAAKLRPARTRFCTEHRLNKHQHRWLWM